MNPATKKKELSKLETVQFQKIYLEQDYPTGLKIYTLRNIVIVFNSESSNTAGWNIPQAIKVYKILDDQPDGGWLTKIYSIDIPGRISTNAQPYSLYIKKYNSFVLESSNYNSPVMFQSYLIIPTISLNLYTAEIDEGLIDTHELEIYNSRFTKGLKKESHLLMNLDILLGMEYCGKTKI